MKGQSLQTRTRQFSLDIIRLCQHLPNDFITRRIADQLLRSGMSVGANYRAALRGRTTAEFISKLGIVEEEADETIFWMEMLLETGTVGQDQLCPIMNEANEIVAMVVASIKTSRQTLKK